MNPRGSAALYTPDILALAVELAHYPLDPTLPVRGEAHSRVCGSRVTMGIVRDTNGAIKRIGARVSACAIGQAAAALFLRSSTGRARADIAAAHAEIDAWLAGGETLPNWPGIAQLASARAYSARHAPILLPWKAALAALSNSAAAE